MGSLLIRLAFWLLLTADLSPGNLAIGLAAALLIPKIPGRPVPARVATAIVLRSLHAVPLAYLQAVWMILRPHPVERVAVHPLRFGFNPFVVFMEIFIVTFTPKTLVLSYDRDGRITVHHIRRKPKP